MSIQLVSGLPGIGTVVRTAPKIIFRDGQFRAFFSGGRFISGSKSRDVTNTSNLDVLQCGTLMGKITTGGQYRPSIIAKTTAAYTSGGTTLTVSAAAATEVARLIALSITTFKLTGPPTAAGTVAATAVTASAASGTSITVSDLGVNKVTDSILTPADGSETPLTIIAADTGIKVTDQDGVSQDQEFPIMPISGTIIEANIINWPADTSTRTYLRGLLFNAAGADFKFDAIWLA